MSTSTNLPGANTPTTTLALPFISIPDVVRERIYAYVLTVNVPESAPWISPLPALTHARNKFLVTLSKLPPISEPHVTRRKNRRKKEAALRRKKEALRARKEEEAFYNAGPPTAPSCLAILATCRQILLEAFHMWYQHNTLNFTRSGDLYTFVLSIGPIRANEIRSIRLDNLPQQDYYNSQAKYALGRLLRLERLVIAQNLEGQGIYPNYYVLPKLVKDLRGLKEVEVVVPRQHSDVVLVSTWIEDIKEKLMRPHVGSRKPPDMMDLFSRLKVETKKTEWDENSAYAPDVFEGC